MVAWRYSPTLAYTHIQNTHTHTASRKENLIYNILTYAGGSCFEQFLLDLEMKAADGAVGQAPGGQPHTNRQKSES